MLYIDDRPTTGEILKKYRINSGMQQSELAEKFECSKSLISSIETDARTLSKDMREKYYKAFEITLREKDEINFYEHYRLINHRIKDYIRDLEEENKKLMERFNELGVAEKIVEIIKKSALKDFLKE